MKYTFFIKSRQKWLFNTFSGIFLEAKSMACQPSPVYPAPPHPQRHPYHHSLAAWLPNNSCGDWSQHWGVSPGPWLKQPLQRTQKSTEALTGAGFMVASPHCEQKQNWDLFTTVTEQLFLCWVSLCFRQARVQHALCSSQCRNQSGRNTLNDSLKFKLYWWVEVKRQRIKPMVSNLL